MQVYWGDQGEQLLPFSGESIVQQVQIGKPNTRKSANTVIQLSD